MKEFYKGDITFEEAVEYYKCELDNKVQSLKEGEITRLELYIFMQGFNFAWISINVEFYDKYLEPYWRLKQIELH